MLKVTERHCILALAASIALAGCAHDQTAPKGPAEEPVSKPAAPAARDIRTEEVSYQAGDATLRGYMAWDASTDRPRPGVLVVHEWWGHNDYARGRAEQLARMGYTALAVDMYGDGKQANHPTEAGKLSGMVMKNIELGVARFEAARKLLEDHPTTDPEKTAAIGYCFGGGVVLHMARIGMDLDMVASFHGMLAPLTTAKKGEVKAKVLVFHGEADEFMSAEVVEAFKKEMTDAEADFEFTSYPGAKHAFTNPDATENGKKFQIPLAYDEDADNKSWAAFSAAMERIFPRN